MRALALSDSQLALLKRIAARLPVSRRDEFLRRVAARLGEGMPSTPAVETAIDQALGCAPEFEGMS
jgi:hypothetical protein